MEDGQHEQQGLYESRFEHDACGVGFVADITGQAARSIITQGIQILGRLLHRGAAGGDAGTGDGAGVMFRIPDPFFRRVCGESGVDLPASGLYGVGMIFMPPDAPFAHLVPPGAGNRLRRNEPSLPGLARGSLRYLRAGRKGAGGMPGGDAVLRGHGGDRSGGLRAPALPAPETGGAPDQPDGRSGAAGSTS